ncbi:MAG: carbohydrate binding family 9 domain-containing protein, partial [Cyclobacteriaceae bacterium]|nr:carbohydrate binding family 9 domain-containing protein [Cyclobacteriaceae bacterium]
MRCVLYFFLVSFLGVVLLPIPSLAQPKNKPGTGLPIAKAGKPIVLDGKLDEPAWLTADVAKNFYLNYPVDSLPPTFQSEARMTFDDHFLYVSFVCYDDSKPDIVQSLRRDVDWNRNDNIGIFLDPFNDYTNGFFFTITPYGVQSEGIISNGGQDGDGSFSNSWDNKWYSHATRYQDRWVAEL